MTPSGCVQSLDAENRTSSGVGGCRGAIPGTRPDRENARARTPWNRVSQCHTELEVSGDEEVRRYVWAKIQGVTEGVME